MKFEKQLNEAKEKVSFHKIMYNIRIHHIIIFTAAGSSSGARTSTSPSPARDIILPTDQFTESDVVEIVKNGFQRERVIAELRSANGNKTQALAALFAKSLKFQ